MQTRPKSPDCIRGSAVYEVVGVGLACPSYLIKKKIWDCLFTWAIYRAAHIELVSDISTETFVDLYINLWQAEIDEQ
ncbi:hypothetical protein CEXT_62811 [Caerostris extrusa]|uniref:Uncharacterized protein n=1 Tax=Caerostris extrusa TaxID=172846 RepID=A0AAV4PAT3_CAEEX|nr:hypothetical protein CEXT_62811 [Caerostris extrusa]